MHKQLDEYYRQFFRASRLYASYAKSQGLSLQEFFLLRLLRDEGQGLCQRDIADSLAIPKQTMSRMLRGLVDQGIVAQAPSPADGREKLYALTETGKARAAQVIGEFDRIEEVCCEELEGKLERFNAINRTYLDAFERHMTETERKDAR